MAKNSSVRSSIIKNWLGNNWGHILSISLFIIFSQVILYDVIYTNKVLVKDDLQEGRHRDKVLHEMKQKYEEEPFWYSNMFAGMPRTKEPRMLHNVLTRYYVAFLFPPTFLSNLFSRDAGMYIMMCIGMYLFLLSFKIKWYAAFAGAILYGFTTNIITVMASGHGMKVLGLGAIPWIFWGYNYMIRWAKESDTWKSNISFLVGGFIAFVAAFSTELYFRHPQVTYIFFYVLIAWWLYNSYQLLKTEKKYMQWLMVSILMPISAIIALTANFGEIWDLYEYSKYSMRTGSALIPEAQEGLPISYAFKWSFSFWEFLSLFMPELYGGSSKQAYWGGRLFAAGPHYIGSITLLLIICAWLWWKQRGIIRFFTITAITCVIFSMGSNIPYINDIIYHYIPLLNRFRAPETWLFVTIFCTSTLAALGIHSLDMYIRSFTKKSQKKLSKSQRKLPKPLYIAMGSIILFGLIFATQSDSLLSFEKSDDMFNETLAISIQQNLSIEHPRVKQQARYYINNELKPQRIQLAKKSAQIFLILNILVAAAIILTFYKIWNIKWCIILLLAIISWDMITMSVQYAQENLISQRNFDNNVKNYNKPYQHFQYIKDNIHSDNLYPYRAFPITDQPFTSNIPSSYFPSLGGYHPAKLSIYEDLIKYGLFNEAKDSLNETTLSMLNTKYVIDYKPIPGWKEVFRQGNKRVYENPNVLPKAFFVEEIKTVSSPQAAMNAINSRQFEPSKIAIVEGDISTTNFSPSNTEKIKFLKYQPNLISLEVERDEPGYMVLSEIYYPYGWTATINGNETLIYKTNYVLRGVEVPAGKHLIQFSYFPMTQKYGAQVARVGRTIVMTLIFGYILFLLQRYIRSLIQIKTQ